MSFFKTKNQAYLAASTVCVLGSIPLLNFGVAASTIMLDTTRFNPLEKKLRNIAVFSTLYYLPALIMLPINLSIMIITAAIEAIEALKALFTTRNNNHYKQQNGESIPRDNQAPRLYSVELTNADNNARDEEMTTNAFSPM